MKQEKNEQHLNIDDMIKYLRFGEITRENLKLASKVATHARQCEECSRKLESLSRLYGEFSRAKTEILSKDLDFEKNVGAKKELEKKIKHKSRSEFK